MTFYISDTFQSSLIRLTADEQRAVKVSVMDMQMNPANPGLQLHRIDKSKDKHFWSARVNRDLRLVIHKTAQTFMVCYVAHHDDAYNWAERRRIETHPTTGAAQIVELKERVEEVVVHRIREEEAPTLPEAAPEELPPLKYTSAKELLSYGIPEEHVPLVQAASQYELLEIAVRLPEEAGEALLVLASGGTPQARQVLQPTTEAEAFQHPDAQRRFQAIDSQEDLQRALDGPWDKWLSYLYADQRELVTQDFKGAHRILGPAGTGKTLIALHRAEYVARTQPDARVLLLSYSPTLVQNLRFRLRRMAIADREMLERIEVAAIDDLATRLYRANRHGTAQVMPKAEVDTLLEQQVQAQQAARLSAGFVKAEWHEIADAYNLQTLDDYANHRRLGRKVALSALQQSALWQIFTTVRGQIREQRKITRPQLFHETAAAIRQSGHLIYDHLIIDECQDLAPYHLVLLAAIAQGRKASLLFLGDDSQRVYQPVFSWKALGFDFQDNQHQLRINYRTGKAIVDFAEPLRDQNPHSVFGQGRLSRQLVSKFEGQSPQVHLFDHPDDEVAACAAWLRPWIDKPAELAIIARTEGQLDRAIAVAQQLGVPYKCLDRGQEPAMNAITICTMPRSKGLEFSKVALVGCDEGVVPYEPKYAEAAQASDLEDIENMERYVLYVACTRTRDQLWVSGLKPGSIFLQDLG